ncbi:MAG: hypothetical protein R2761_02940 [Acidimicrobiales bacterium]
MKQTSQEFGAVRALAAVGDDYYGVVQSEDDAATLQRLRLEGSTFLFGPGEPLARFGVTDGPIALAANGPRDFVVGHTVQHTIARERYSSEMSDAYRRWLEEDMGAPAPPAPTGGTYYEHEVTVTRPSLLTVSGDSVSAAALSGGALPDVCLEPIALRSTADGYLLIATSSGRYGTESNIADQVVMVSLGHDHVVEELHPIVVDLGHELHDVRAVETVGGGFVVAVRDGAGTRYFSTEKVGHVDPFEPDDSLRRFAQHDRLPVAGLANGWMVELGPGIYSVENSDR